jgi:hypothetical protein
VRVLLYFLSIVVSFCYSRALPLCDGEETRDATAHVL